jgi:predicted porin
MKIHTSFLLVATFIMPALAQADGPIDGEVYGRINLSLDHVDLEDELTILQDIDEWQLNSLASRFGVRGETKIDDPFTVIYQFEWQVDTDGDSTDLTPRNRFLGLKGDFGTVLAGRHDTPLKLSQNKIDLFNDNFGDIGVTFSGEVRAANIVMYSTPDLGNFSGRVAFIPGEDTANGDDGLSDGISAMGSVQLDDLYLAIAVDQDVASRDVERFVAQWSLGDLQLGGMLQSSQSDNGDQDETGIFTSLAYTMGKNELWFQIGVADNDSVTGVYEEERTISLGLARNLGSNTSVLGYFTSDVKEAPNGDETDLTVFGVRMEHKF